MLARGEFDADVDARLRRGSSAGPFAVLLLRLQRIRETNLLLDDELIAAASGRIAEALRPNDRLTQIGGCDFAILLPDLLNRNHAVLAAHRLIRAFDEPLPSNGVPTIASVVIGVAMHPDHGESRETLCRHAEVAFGRALRAGESFAVYDGESDGVGVPYEAVQEAVANNRMEVYLQPLLDLRSGRIAGAESLARWTSPSLGSISPSRFVPYTERTGLITALTRWSFNASLRHSASARRVGKAIPLSINLSARVFHIRGIVEQIIGSLLIWDVPPEDVILEVTENAVMEDPKLSADVLGRMRDAGLGIAIDDFGTGYSSFTYLKQFPTTELKIDQSFVRDMLTDRRSHQLVRSMIDLAHHLGIIVVAEGVENAALLEYLAETGCDYAQGYYVGRPRPAEEFIAAFDPAAVMPLKAR